jgi:hypothetical protein
MLTPLIASHTSPASSIQTIAMAAAAEVGQGDSSNNGGIEIATGGVEILIDNSPELVEAGSGLLDVLGNLLGGLLSFFVFKPQRLLPQVCPGF